MKLKRPLLVATRLCLIFDAPNLARSTGKRHQHSRGSKYKVISQTVEQRPWDGQWQPWSRGRSSWVVFVVGIWWWSRDRDQRCATDARCLWSKESRVSHQPCPPDGKQSWTRWYAKPPQNKVHQQNNETLACDILTWRPFSVLHHISKFWVNGLILFPGACRFGLMLTNDCRWLQKHCISLSMQGNITASAPYYCWCSRRLLEYRGLISNNHCGFGFISYRLYLYLFFPSHWQNSLWYAVAQKPPINVSGFGFNRRETNAGRSIL